MAMNELECLNQVLSDAAYRGENEIHIDTTIAERAKLPLDRMLSFKA
jgi:quinolinate synthase